jgi:hypothetical protein
VGGRRPEGEDLWPRSEGRRPGDGGDHVALDLDTRPVLEVGGGPRTADLAVAFPEGVRDRLGGRAPALITSDEWSAYPGAVLAVFGDVVVPPRTGTPGRPPGPRAEPPPGMCYAPVHKTRDGHRVVAVGARVVFGALGPGGRASTSDLERPSATDRHRNARKGRKTYRFSKAAAFHEGMTDFTPFTDDFCGPPRTLETKDESGRPSGPRPWRPGWRTTSGR